MVGSHVALHLEGLLGDGSGGPLSLRWLVHSASTAVQRHDHERRVQAAWGPQALNVSAQLDAD